MGTTQVFKSRCAPARRPLSPRHSLLEVLYENVPDLLHFMTKIKMTKILYSTVRKLNWNVYLVLSCLMKDLDEYEFMRAIKFELGGQEGGDLGI